MAEENNKLNAELKRVEDDLFTVDDFSAKDPVPLDSTMKPVEHAAFAKPLPLEEDLNPVAAGFVPVREHVVHDVPPEKAPEIHIMPEIKTFSESRPLQQNVFNEPLKVADAIPVQESAPTPEFVPVQDVAPVQEEKNVAEAVSREVVPAAVPGTPKAAPVHHASSVQHQKIAVRNVENASLGTILREARTACALKVEQVAEATKIRLDYIIAIEKDDFKRLPPVVFIRAYSRSLGMLYRLDQPTLDKSMSWKLRLMFLNNCSRSSKKMFRSVKRKRKNSSGSSCIRLSSSL